MAGFPDSLIEKYRPVRLLASGGFGAVWECTTPEGARLALKLPHEMGGVAADELRRFMDEARLTAALAHPHVVTVHACSAPADPIPWIAYELLPGPSLRQWLTAARPEPAALVEVARQITSALAAAHAAGVVHRDIKPDNVLAGADQLWKVTDFGVARFNDNPVKTKTGIILGTPAYLAPEVIAGDRAAPATDLYAVGVILYEGLTGRVPHHSDDGMQILMARLTTPADPVRRHRPDAPAPLADLVDRMVAHKPAERLPTAGAVLGALEACLATERTARSPSPRSRNRRESAGNDRATGAHAIRASGGPTARESDHSAGAHAARASTGHAVRPARTADRSRFPLKPALALLVLCTATLAGLLVEFRISRNLETQKVETGASRAPDGPAGAAGSSPAPPASSLQPPASRLTPHAFNLPTPIPLTRWLCDEPGSPPRVPLVVVASASGVTLALTPAVTGATLDGKPLGTGTVVLPPLAPGLHWLAFTAPARAALGELRGLPAFTAEAGADGDPPEAALELEIFEAANSRQVWETEEAQLKGAAPAGSARAIAKLALPLRSAAEVPQFMNLFEDKTAGVRLVWHVNAREIRERTTALLAALEPPLNRGVARWDLWHRLGWVLANTDQRPQARRALVRALGIWPESPWTWLELARLEERERRIAIESKTGRAIQLAISERMGLAASQAFRFMPKQGPAFMRRLRDDATVLHRQATDDRHRLQ